MSVGLFILFITKGNEAAQFLGGRSGRRSRLGRTVGNRRYYLTIPNHIQQRNNIGTSRQVLQDLDLTLDLLLLDRLQNLDNALLIVDNIDTFEDFRVFPSPYAKMSAWWKYT